MEKIILTYGTFDLFHVGHLNLLNRLRELGDKLIVGVSTDDFNLQKGKSTIIPYEQRAKIVQSLKCVDEVIPESSWDQKITDIKKYQVSVFAMGDDWEGKFDFLKEYCEVIYFKRTKDISSTQIKDTLNSITKIKDDFLKAIEILEQLKKDFK
jgi:glycerol-3-phosphate cytidylyltransferase